jgi:hypothetical protein
MSHLTVMAKMTNKWRYQQMKIHVLKSLNASVNV